MTNESQLADIELLQESVAALEAELALLADDAGWRRMLGGSTDEFSKHGINEISVLARIMYLKNPLINRGVEVKKDYVFGQGIQISAVQSDINAVIQAFLDDEKNQSELTSHQALQQKEIERQTDGNIFLILFTNQRTGRVRVRSVPLAEICDKVCNPNDAKEVWYFKREWEWTQTTIDGKPVQMVRYYPNWRYRPASKPAQLNGVQIEWDAPIYHIKSGGFSDWRWGIADVYSALDWAKAYKAFLEDWATITRALARFAFKVKTAGGARAVSAAKARINTTLGTGQGERNPPPAAGSTWIGSEHVEMEPIKTAGATTSMEDGRRLLLMVAASVGLPETFFGDASVGSLATARSLDRPTELMMKNIQSFWSAVLGDILRYVIYWAVVAPAGKLRTLATVDFDDDDEEILVWSVNPETSEPYSPTVRVDFPPIVEIDPLATIQSIQAAAPSLPDVRLIARMLLVALGETNIDELLDAMFDEQNQLDAEVSEAARQVRGELAQLLEAIRVSAS